MSQRKAQPLGQPQCFGSGGINICQPSLACPCWLRFQFKNELLVGLCADVDDRQYLKNGWHVGQDLIGKVRVVLLEHLLGLGLVSSVDAGVAVDEVEEQAVHLAHPNALGLRAVDAAAVRVVHHPHLESATVVIVSRRNNTRNWFKLSYEGVRRC